MLLKRLEAMIPDAQATGKRLKTEYGDRVVGLLTVDQVLGGMAGAKVIKSFVPGGPHYVDPEHSLHIGGVGIFDICRTNTFEWLVWNLYTGSPPTAEEEEWLRARFERARAGFLTAPFYTGVNELLGVVCRMESMDPMKAIDMVVGWLSETTRMSEKVRAGAIHEITWQDRIEDQLDLLGYLAVIVPMVYRKLYGSARESRAQVEGHRFAEAFVEGLGIEGDFELQSRIMDQLLATMCYHGPGNVSTFCAIVANSGGANAHETFGAMVNGLRGYNHGGAAEQGVRFLFQVRDHSSLGIDASEDRLGTLARVRLTRSTPRLPIWCVGHRIIRGEKGDQRANATVATLEEHFADDPFFQMSRRWYEAAKPMVSAHTPAKFADVNVDGYTGLLANLAGIIREPHMAQFAGAIFATSRASGAFAETFWQAAGGALRLVRPSALSEGAIASLPEQSAFAETLVEA